MAAAAGRRRAGAACGAFLGVARTAATRWPRGTLSGQTAAGHGQGSRAGARKSPAGAGLLSLAQCAGAGAPVTDDQIALVTLPDLRQRVQTYAFCGRPSFTIRTRCRLGSKRRFDPNLQRVRILVKGHPKHAYVCTRCLKSGKVTKAV